MHTFYVDETGDHSLASINPHYPIFVLGGVVIDTQYHDNIISADLDDLKTRIFNQRNLPLHLYSIKKIRPPFGRLKNRRTRNEFWAEMTRLMRSWDYSIIACAIDKPKLRRMHRSRTWNAYYYALEVLLERFTFYLEETGTIGQMVVESRRPDLNQEFLRTVNNFMQNGTRLVEPHRLTRRIKDVRVHPKSANIAGLQLADFLMSPIGRHEIGKPDNVGWQIAEEKFRRHPNTGDYLGTGLVRKP